jgi:hypothetical protein
MASTLRRCAVRHTDEGKRTTVSRRRNRVRAVVIGVAAASVCILSPLPIANADDPYLVSTWSGHRERIASTDGYRNGEATLVVTEQTGLTFKGSTLDYCYSEHGAGYRTTCGRLQKQV